MTCKVCGVLDGTRAAVVGGVYYSSICDSCVASNRRAPESSAAEYHRQRDREDHAKDILQPHAAGKVNLDFARAYPDMWQNHYTDDEIKQIRRQL